jgi:hypothetical protein
MVIAYSEMNDTCLIQGCEDRFDRFFDNLLGSFDYLAVKKRLAMRENDVHALLVALALFQPSPGLIHFVNS